MGQVTGGCLCGNVRFTAVGQPYRVGLCHCLDCRKHHGALFHASAVFPQEAVLVQGETAQFQGRHFCPRCGSPVFSITRLAVRRPGFNSWSGPSVSNSPGIIGSLPAADEPGAGGGGVG